MIAGVTWPHARAGEAIAALADAAGLGARGERIGAPPADRLDEAWLIDAGRWIGIDIEPVATAYGEVEAMLRGSAPAIVEVPGGVIAIVRARGGALIALGPDLRRARIPIAEVAATLRRPVEAPSDGVAVTPLTAVLRATRLRFEHVGGVAMLRRAVGAPVRDRLRDLRASRRIAAIVAIHLVGFVSSVVAWAAIGHTILSGTIDAGWLAAWALLVATGTIARIATNALTGPLALDAATVLRERMLAGALRLPADAIRGDGAGRALGRVFEANALEELAVGGGFTALLATVELVVVGTVLAFGAGGLLHVGLLVATVALAVLGGRRYFHARVAWTEQRLAITHELVDSMIGHATRLAQQPAIDRHTDEDRALATYAQRSVELDRHVAWLQAMVPRGWLVVAVIGLAPALMLGPVEIPALAIALGGIVLGHGALTKLGDAATRLTDAAVAWRSVAPLVEAGGTALAVAPPALACSVPSPGQPLVMLRGVRYQPPRGSLPVLASCDLEIRDGDRVVLEGASGSGKSTLAAVVAGLRRPDAGLVLAGGLDRATLGERGWRRRIALVPQFHDNHVFFGSLAFNVLMTRTWPPSAADLTDADTVLRELGLGPLVDRMPGGMSQIVGETGWTLSHGERGRVFIARALLSGAPLVILDESLAALDPQTLIKTLACIDRRAGAALVIAHP